jgi:predicted protein tyrosine phosphatase
MKRFLKLKPLILGLTLIILLGLTYVLFTDSYSQARFRTMQDPISNTEEVDLTGLHELQVSGGPSIIFSNLKDSLSHVNKKIIIVDGIRQYHGYIKEVPTTFFAYERHDPDWRHFIRRLIYTGTTQIRPDLVAPEKELAEKHGFIYENIKIDSKVRTPDEAVDDFVAFVDSLPDDVWVHFHCRLGKGRTSMLLIMFDTMKNAPKVALKDIVKRQHLLGSENLFNTVARNRGTYHSSTLMRRKQFIEAFYEFIYQRKEGGIQKWSEWHALHPTPEPVNLDFQADAQ